MKRKPFHTLRHASMMARRNLRSYLMLSVTIVLSYALLLGYLVFTDSSIYNLYKTVFSRDRSVVYAGDNQLDQDRVNLLLKKAGEIGQTHSLTILRTSAYFTMSEFQTENGEALKLPPAGIHCVPSRCWDLYEWSEKREVRWLDGREHTGVQLASGEAIIDDVLFQVLKLDEMETPTYHFVLNNGLESKYEIEKTYTIVGTVPSDAPLMLDTKSIPGIALCSNYYHPVLFLPVEDVNPSVAKDWDWGRSILFYTDSPEAVTELAKSVHLDGGVDPVYDMQDTALQSIRAEKRVKATITAAMLLILGINLYSSFSNALNDRRFEIGVKRAVGAPKRSIVGQFLCESLLVLSIDILISVWLVSLVSLVYKLIYENTPDQFGDYHDFILYLSPYSAAMFAVCAVTLTVVFSLIFAYRSTQVQVVDYLKAE